MNMVNWDQKDYYINREISWISFNKRVLGEAAVRSNPLLERLKFLAIAASNLDEFFMVRVAGLKDMVKAGNAKPDDKESMTPKEQLAAITSRVHEMTTQMYQILNDQLLPELALEGICFRKPYELTFEQKLFLQDYYNDFIFPVLTPMAVDASHPFPFLLNKSLNIAVLLESEREGKSKPLFAVVQVPSVLPRYVELPTPDDRLEFVLLEDIIAQHIDTLFLGNRILEFGSFRITRNADMSVDEEGAEDLLIAIERELKKRKMGAAVRLEVSVIMSEVLLETLRLSLELKRSDVYRINGPIDPTFYMKFSGLSSHDHLRFQKLDEQPPRDLIGENSIYDAVREKDVLVSHPYESFEPVLHFITQAAEDPQVLAIKQTLYRVSGNSPIVAALARAAENGKQVTVLLELKARFDEENNISWAKKLEKHGCHVIYGLAGLKTHSKITLIVRQEEEGLRRYVHLGTGNYNDTTARIYTDLGLFTSDEDFGVDASAFFNHLTGYGTTPTWRKIITAPNGMKERFLQLIDNEIAKSTPDNPGHIIAKMNSLTNKEIIQKLFEASTAGVQIDLIIRGVCCLRPGIPGVSENIRVFSIVGRFLEHSRVYYFKNGGEERVFLSSADWMSRNLQGRVEILFPVEQENLLQRIKRVLHIQLQDNSKRHELQANGEYVKIEPDGEEPLDSQLLLHQEAEQEARLKEMNTYFLQVKPKTHLLDV